MSNKLTDRETYDPAAVAEYVWDTLCRYRHNIDLTQDELEEICENCNMERLLGITEEIEECKEGEKMGREILFRGKCIDATCLKGQWLEGQILHDGVTGKYYIHRDNCLNESDNVGEEGLLQFVAYEVDPKTVCQYTGLTDKNGRKIFKGDICKYYNSEDKDGIAVIGEDYAEWKSGTIRQKEIMTPLFYLKCSKEWEVIGNIFDNPELLEEVQNEKEDR